MKSSQIFQFLCAANDSSPLEPEELSFAADPDMRSFLKCTVYNFTGKCDLAAHGDFHSDSVATPIIHLCDFKVRNNLPECFLILSLR